MKYLVNRETKEHRILNEEVGGVTLVHTSVKLWDIVEADPEGWIKHDKTREMPVPVGCKVDIKFMDGFVCKAEDDADRWAWSYASAYRPILDKKPEASPVPCSKAEESLIERLKSSHKAASELPDIIAELREVLGPDLMEMLVAKSKFTDKVKRYHEDFSILAAQIKDPQAEPEPDMTDWRNWREGDLVECISTDGDGYGQLYGVRVGDIRPILSKSGSGVIVNYAGSLGRERSYRFHSRPTKEQDNG